MFFNALKYLFIILSSKFEFFLASQMDNPYKILTFH
jgi:hypothetical protein